MHETGARCTVPVSLMLFGINSSVKWLPSIRLEVSENRTMLRKTPVKRQRGLPTSNVGKYRR